MKKSDQTRERGAVRYLTPLHPDFPERLKNIPSPPRGIYVLGRLPDAGKPAVAIIGSRSASAYGIGVAKYFSSSLADAGVQVISGMARGIDGIAQRAAVEGGHASFGVLGCGVDVVYPKENRDLFLCIPEKGGLISEYPPGTEPKGRLFPSRNRLIAGFADLLLVIEARVKSGTSITVRCALDQGKDVFAVPGRLTDPMSAGCNQLLRDGAGLALSPESVLEALHICREDMEIPARRLPDEGEAIRKNHLAKREKKVYIALDLYPKNLDELSAASGLSVRELPEILLRLEFLGLAAGTGQNSYYRKR